MSRSNLIDLSVMVHAETEKAVLVSEDGEKKNAVWLPKSQCEVLTATLGRARACVVTLPEWLAKDKGLI